MPAGKAPTTPPDIDLDYYIEGLARGDHAVLARAITLIESSAERDRLRAGQLLEAALPLSGRAHRIGITGPPGAGKSTTIEALGAQLTRASRMLAILTIDPTSAQTGGSVLGDKTRMPQLATSALAFVRPTPSGAAPGGVAARTGDAIILCEAAGAEIVIVETVGAGQTDTAVGDLVDTVVLVLTPGAGDELQGLKRGIVEHADIIAVNKADRGNEALAEQTAADYQTAAGILSESDAGWAVPVVSYSAVEGSGLDTLWRLIERHAEEGRTSGRFDQRRKAQSLRAFERAIDGALREALLAHSDTQKLLKRLREQVADGAISPAMAAQELISTLKL